MIRGPLLQEESEKMHGMTHEDGVGGKGRSLEQHAGFERCPQKDFPPYTHEYYYY